MPALEADDRAQPGHWEADFRFLARYRQSVLVLHERTSRLTFFCDPHSPSQKGGIENAIDPNQIIEAAQAFNNVPRRCLDFLTPAEVFSNVLHFERESTSRLSPG